MWRSRLFWQLFSASGLLMLVVLIILGAVILQRVEDNRFRHAEKRLKAEALIVQELIRNQPPEAVRAVMNRLAPQNGVARITLINTDGVVLADTEGGTVSLENHASRPEIVQAGTDGVGVARRYSAALGQDLLYLALRTDINGEPAYVRVALPLAVIQDDLVVLHRLIWIAVAVTGALSLGLTFWLVRGVLRPLQNLSRSVDLLAAGRPGQRVRLGGPGEVRVLAESLNNMSERLAARIAQLEEDRQQLRTVLSSMVEGVIAVDADQRILFANERAGHLLEFPATRAVGRPLWDLVRQRPVQDVVRSAMSDGQDYARELVWSGLTARRLSVHVARLPGTPARGAVLVFHDTTELRRLENLRQEFAANVSHELKTPLAIIKACVETLIDGAMDDPDHRGQFLQRIDEQSERLHRLILDLLHLARMESETEVFSMEELDVEPEVMACIERQRTLAESKRQKLLTQPPAEHQGPIIAWADAEAVQQILDNLVDNALKYTPEEGTITIGWWRDGGQVFIEVRDTGIGIPESELPRIFERFYRVDKARSRELGGTGLGLSIVKHLTQAMQGSVQCQSQLDRGTTFTVRLALPS